MKVGVILSCMNQTDASLVDQSNLKDTNVFVINQCTCDKEELTVINEKCKILNTNTKGLSISRNLGINMSDFDICVVSDDDEIFSDDLEKIVKDAYSKYKDADVVIFKVGNIIKKLGSKSRKLKWKDCLRVSSIQITFRRKRVIESNIKFDPLLGAGTGNGAAEENKFLLDCRKRNLNIYFVPIEIAVVNKDHNSTWFFGFDEKYFYNLGKSLRYILGFNVSVLYAVYTLVSKRKLFKDIPITRATKFFFRGIINNELGRKSK